MVAVLFYFILLISFVSPPFSLTCGQTPSANASWTSCSVSALARRTSLSRTGSESVSPCSTWTSPPSCPGSSPCTSFPSWSPRVCVVAPRSPGTGSSCQSRCAYFQIKSNKSLLFINIQIIKTKCFLRHMGSRRYI